MDYEKKYNEALNWMRELYPGLHGATKEDAEHYFPELRESEDEKMMNQLHSWMMEFGGAEEYAERVFQWLKGLLEKQKEQKPAEWSEEDERMIRCITNRIESDIQYGNELTKAYGNQEISWLKSLRSQLHWKPSEEQIGALNYAYCELFKRKDVGHNILGPLQKLCDELKKLM